MSKNETKSFGRDLAKAMLINMAASAASMVGLFGGLAIVGKLIDKYNEKTNH